MSLVLDASVPLASVNGEPGGKQVLGMMDGGPVSAVNSSEVVQKAIRSRTNVDGMLEDLEDRGLSVVPFTASQAANPARRA